MKQELCRKDVEHAFRVFQLLRAVTFFFIKKVIHDTLTLCIILHNVIIEDERHHNAPTQDVIQAPSPMTEMVVDKNL